MGFTFKSKRLGYDNIASGSAAGLERHVVGGGPGDVTTRMLKDSVGGSGTSTIELHVNAGQDTGTPTSNNSFVNRSGAAGGNDAVATSGDIPGSTSNSSFYTSATSWTTVFPERL